MHPITTNSIAHLSSTWKEKHARLLEAEHWTSLIEQFNAYLNEENLAPRLPYFDEEIDPQIEQVISYFRSQYKVRFETEKHSDSAWAKVLENAPFEYLLVILGQRLTSSSVRDETAIPPLKETLLKSCFEPYNDKICAATRAWEKHVGRSKDDFWGEIKGSAWEREQKVKGIVVEMIKNKTWWNVFCHYQHDLVYEIRVSSGHGIRWNEDGTSIIGFLEPFLQSQKDE